MDKVDHLINSHLDKSKLFALNFSATQEIDRIQQGEKTNVNQYGTNEKETRCATRRWR